MKRIAALLAKDAILGVKDVFVILEVVFAVIVAVLLVFVVPEDIRVDQSVFIYDQTGILEEFLEGLPLDIEQVGEVMVASREAVIDGLVANRSALGVVISDAGGDAPPLFDVELLTQPYTQEAVENYIGLELEDLLSIIGSTRALGRDLGASGSAGAAASLYPPEVLGAVRVQGLQEGLRDEIPLNRRLLPMILLVVVGIIGLFTMVSLLGQERADQTIRAFRVSPGGLWSFIASKHLLLLLVGAATFSIIYIPTMGLTGYLPALLIIALTIVVGSSIGTLLSAYFDNPMGSIGWIMLLMVVLNLPSISLLAPTFSPFWLRLIPSYYTLFGLDAVMFPDNNGHIIGESAAVLAGVAVLGYLLSSAIFISRIKREQ